MKKLAKKLNTLLIYLDVVDNVRFDQIISVGSGA